MLSALIASMSTAGASNVSKFVRRNNGNSLEQRDGRGSPSARRVSSHNRQTTDNAGISHAERLRKAEAARMPMPQTSLNHPKYLKSESAPDMKGLARAVANRPLSASSSHATLVSLEHVKNSIANS